MEKNDSCCNPFLEKKKKERDGEIYSNINVFQDHRLDKLQHCNFYVGGIGEDCRQMKTDFYRGLDWKLLRLGDRPGL